MTNPKTNDSENLNLPNNFLAEQGIINILLTNPMLVEKTILLLKSDAFYFSPHRIIYTGIVYLYENEKVINLTTIITYLQDMGLLEEIGGLERIITIINRFGN